MITQNKILANYNAKRKSNVSTLPFNQMYKVCLVTDYQNG
jgi:hypothetical protein